MWAQNCKFYEIFEHKFPVGSYSLPVHLNKIFRVCGQFHARFYNLNTEDLLKGFWIWGFNLEGCIFPTISASLAATLHWIPKGGRGGEMVETSSITVPSVVGRDCMCSQRWTKS